MQKHIRSKIRSGQALRAIALSGDLFNRWLHGSPGWQKPLLLLLLGLLLPLCNLQAQTTYTWVGGATGVWGTSTNWSPTRSTPAITDIIKFDPAANGGVANITVTAFATDNIGRLEVSNGAIVAIQHTAAAQQQIKINGDGGALTDVYVETGSTFKMDNKAAITVNLGLVFVGTGHTAVIDGTLELTGQNNYFNTAGATVTVNGTFKNAGVLNVTTNTTINGTFNNLTTYSSTVSPKSINITSAGQMVINGTFENSATSPVSSTASNLTFAGSSIYNHNFTTATTGALNAIPTATWSSGSEVKIKGYTTFNAQVTGLGQTFSKFTWDCPNQTSTSKPYINASGMVVLDAFYLKSTGAGALKISNTTATTVTVNNFVQTGGSLDFYSGSTTSLANSLKVSGTFDQQGGTITESGSSTANTIEFNGTLSQAVNFAGTVSNLINHNINNTGGITLTGTMPVNTGATLTITTAGSSATGGTGSIAYTGTTTLKYNSSSGAQTATGIEFPVTNGPTNLTIDNSNGVSLSADGTVPGTLTLTTGLLRLNNYNLTISSLAITSPSAAKMIIPGTGQLKKIFAAGASTFTFPIGEETSSTDYLPVTLSFTANSLQRTIGVSMTKSKHGSIDVGGVQTDYLNRYWRFSDSEVNNGTYAYTAGFTYLPADVNGTEANIKVNYWDGASWSQIGSSAGSGQLSITLAQSETSAPLHNNDFTGRVTAASSFTWNGGTSSDWLTVSNWTPAGIPTATDDVTISNASAVNQPVVLSGSAVSARSLILTAGSLTLAGTASLTVEGNFTFSAPANTNFDCSSTFTYANSGSQTIYDLAYGNLISTGTAARTLANGNIEICGTFTPGTNSYTVGTSTVAFNSASAQPIPGFNYYNLDGTGGNRTISGTVKIEGAFTPGFGTYTVTGSTVEFNGASTQTIPAFNYNNLTSSSTGNRTIAGTVKIAGTFTGGTNTYIVTGSTVEYNGTGAQTIPVLSVASGGNYHTLQISGSGTKTFGGSMIIDGNLTQSGATVDVLNSTSSAHKTITVNGNFDLSGIAGTAFRLINSSALSGTTTVTVNGNMTVSGAANANLEPTGSTNGTAILNVKGDFSTIGAYSGTLTLGNGITSAVSTNAMYVGGNFSMTGTGKFNTSGNGETKGIIFNGTSSQAFSWTSSSISTNTQFTVENGSTVLMNAGLTLGTGTLPASKFTVNATGTLDLQDKVITASNATDPVFTISGTVKTANADGLSSAISGFGATKLTLGTASTIEFNGTGAQAITARSDYQNLVISGNRGGAAITLEPGTIGVAKTFDPGATTVSWITTGNTVEFKGITQTVPELPYNNLKISGGDTKTLAGNITVNSTLTMNSGILQTGTNKIVLGGTATVTESASSYVTGNVESATDMSTAGSYTFNGIGLTLTPAGSNFPGVTTVRRVTGTPISANGNQGITRFFEIIPTTNQNLNVTMVFSYQDHELNNIPEGNLVFFKSDNGTAGPWVPKGADASDPLAKTVTLNGITDFSTWTLGNSAAPLPVEMVAFNAKKAGSDVEVTWITASEKNSQGYEVQVSTNGKEFRKLGLLESHNGNTLQQYQFRDIENGKSGIRYYRLKQIDLDGTVSYYGPKTVRFEVEKLQVSIYPNPFAQEINLSITATDAGKATLKFSDLSGKVVFEQETQVQQGNNKLSIGMREKLPIGFYLLRIQLGSELITTRLLKK